MTAVVIAVLGALTFGAVMFVAGIYVFQWGYRYGRRSAYEDKFNLPPAAVTPAVNGEPPEVKAQREQLSRVMGMFDEPRVDGRQ